MALAQELSRNYTLADERRVALDVTAAANRDRHILGGIASDDFQHSVHDLLLQRLSGEIPCAALRLVLVPDADRFGRQ